MWKLGLLCCRICWRPFSSKQTMGTRHAINSCWTYTGVHPWPFGLQDETALHADPFPFVSPVFGLWVLSSGCWHVLLYNLGRTTWRAVRSETSDAVHMALRRSPSEQKVCSTHLLLGARCLIVSCQAYNEQQADSSRATAAFAVMPMAQCLMPCCRAATRFRFRWPGSFMKRLQICVKKRILPPYRRDISPVSRSSRAASGV